MKKMEDVKMRAIKIDPIAKTIKEVDIKNANKSLNHFYELIGCDLIELVYLDEGIVMVIDEESKLKEIKGAFKFWGNDDLIIAGIAIVIGDKNNKFEPLQESKNTFEQIIEWVEPNDVPPPRMEFIAF